MLDGWKRALPAVAAVPIVMLAGGRERRGQGAGEEAPEFDVERAYLIDETMFVPFLVEETEPLAEALREGVVEEETSLLVMEHPGPAGAGDRPDGVPSRGAGRHGG